MRKYLPNLVLFGALLLIAIIGALAFLTASKLAVLLDPAAKDSHLARFMVAIIGVAVAVASAFPIFSRALPWFTARLDQLYPPHPPVLEFSSPDWRRDPS
jgi:hypothetical protein